MCVYPVQYIDLYFMCDDKGRGCNISVLCVCVYVDFGMELWKGYKKETLVSCCGLVLVERKKHANIISSLQSFKKKTC